ncbi:MAG: 3-dehydroquinate synthase [Christensenellaceae bacterium]|jgi:3-dehydroquinate synthase|nr:3-dehydroquinate synthase [Christensenellaceae bacterium]
MEKILVTTSSENYQVTIGPDLLKMASDFTGVKLHAFSKVAILTDTTVDPLYSNTLISSLNSTQCAVYKYIIPSGERSKSIIQYEKILNFLADNNFTRQDVLLALGGGVVGDLGGFVAATFKRGINYIQVPTTLLSMIDSSVGGKTGINLSSGKNFVGAFYQPRSVIADTNTLKTLPAIELINGLGELIKYGILAGYNIFSAITKDNYLSQETLAKCIQYKAEIVRIDEKEKNQRMLLNLGHTIGHAIERLSEYTIPHGLAVGIGISIIAKACYKNSLLSKSDYLKISDCLTIFNIPLESEFDMKSLINASLGDKKVINNNFNLVIIRQIGVCEILPLSLDDFREFFL